MSTAKPGRLMRWMQALGALYDRDLGWLLGHRMVRLTHVGRRSGRRYRTMLEVLGVDQRSGEIFVISGFGPSADWYRNVNAVPAVEIAIGNAKFRPSSRAVAIPEAVEVLADYERRNRLAAPLLRRALSWLAGWPYDGSDQARRRLVAQCPMVGFRPTKSPAES